MDNTIRSLTTLECVSSHTGVSHLELYQYVRHRERYYRTFRVAKKSGGYRKIQAPCVRLKNVQRWIATTILADVPLHDACTGYRKGHSIVTNAAPHTGADFVFNVDIAQFFPSIKEARVARLFASLGYGDKMARQFAALTTVDGVLPQGAPSSPQIANLICRTLDERLQAFATQHGWAYTRYCDDITISGGGDFRHQQRTVCDIIETEGFTVNHDKLRQAGRGQRQEVTGLVVNAFVNIPRERRRLIRAMVHRELSQNDNLTPGEGSARLHGLLSFAKMVRDGSAP